VLLNGHPLARYPGDRPADLAQALADQAQAWPLRTFHPVEAGFQVQLERGGSGADSLAMEGSKVGFSVRSPRPAYFLMLDIDPYGRVTVLYPDGNEELARIPAGQVVDLGGQVRVHGPFGTDYVKVFAFSPSAPAGLSRWVGAQGLVPGSPDYQALSCLVGLGGRGDRGCHPSGVAETTFTLVTYPQAEAARP
jgi:hypothetical protein